MAITNTELVNRIQDIATNYNTVYLYGGWGQQVTKSVVDSKASQFPSYYSSDLINTTYYPLIDKGYWGFDCVNLIKAICWGWVGDKSSVNGGATYGTNNCPDKSANQMIEYCNGVSNDFTDVKLGEALWCEGHFGIYIGDGYAIEATPKWGYTQGVKVSAVNNMGKHPEHNRQRTWTKHGFLPFVEYTGISVDIYATDRNVYYDTTDSESSLAVGNSFQTGSYNFVYEEYESIANLSEQPFHAFVELWIGDTHIPPIPPQNLLSLEATSLTENSVSTGKSAITATISLFDKYCDELEYLFIKNYTNIKLRFGHVSGRQTALMNLTATYYSVNVTPAGNILTVQLISSGEASASNLLTGNIGDSPSEAVKTICKNVGWTIGRIDDAIQLTGQGGNTITFNLLNDNPIDYIRNVIAPRSIRASDGKGGYQFYLDSSTEPNTAYFKPIDLEDGGLKTYVYQKGKNCPLLDFNISGSIAMSESSVSQYLSSGIDPLTKDEFNFVSNYSETKMDTTAKYTTIIDSKNSKINITDNLSPEEISATVSYRFINNATIGELSANGTVTIVGDPTMAVSDVIRIILLNNDNTMHNLSGLYFVSGVNHNITNGTMLTTLNVYKQGNIDGSVELKSAKLVK